MTWNSQASIDISPSAWSSEDFQDFGSGRLAVCECKRIIDLDSLTLVGWLDRPRETAVLFVEQGVRVEAFAMPRRQGTQPETQSMSQHLPMNTPNVSPETVAFP